jgi:hypothetical protein
MKHVRFVTVQPYTLPDKASLLEESQEISLVAQKVAIGAAVATAIGTLAVAFNTFTQGTERIKNTGS